MYLIVLKVVEFAEIISVLGGMGIVMSEEILSIVRPAT